MANLRTFYNDFCTNADHAVVPMWKYAEFETKFGTRRELQFIGQTALLMQLPDGQLSLLVVQTQEHRVYKHVAYMIAQFLGQALTEAESSLQLQVHGQALQALRQVPGICIEELLAAGTLERENRFGVLTEHEVSRINGVRLSRKQ